MQRTKESKRHLENRSRLEGLGFGSDSILMSDPKLFLDSAFLAIVTAEFQQELGEDCSRQALQEIGRHHGLCDAIRTLSAASTGDGDAGFPPAQTGPHLAMQFASPPRPAQEFVLQGSWPECHEARARLSRLSHTEGPSCFLSAGYTAGWLAEIYDAEVEVVETACEASGGETCRFEARIMAAGTCRTETPRPSPEKDATPPMEFPIESFGPEITDSSHHPDSPSPLDPEEDAVQVWGPVMVLPFSDPEVAETTLLELEMDSLSSEIGAVVIDLRGRSLDTNSEQVRLERILKVIARWQAQAVFAGVSRATEATLQRFDSGCLIARKKLSEAIAVAFQIAEAQSHSV